MADSRTMSRYLNLLTDYAFKMVFGQDRNKDILLDFINAVLDGDERVVELQYRNSERLGLVDEDRKVVFDLLCENDRGEKILVELQQARENWFKDRALFYASSLIQEQGIRGKWDYHLKATYVIAILNFTIESGSQFVHRIFLHNQTTSTRWSNSLQMVFLEIPKVPEQIQNCQSHFIRWLHLIGHMHHFSDMPQETQVAIFQRLFQICEIGKFPESERKHYLKNLSETERMEEAIKYAKEYAEQVGHEKGYAEGLSKGLSAGLSQGLSQGLSEGLSQGRSEGLSEGEKNLLNYRTEAAKRLLEKGVEVRLIQESLGLSEKEWAQIKADY